MRAKRRHAANFAQVPASKREPWASDLLELACRPAGISSRSVQGQHLVAAHTGVRHLLLSDPELQLALALRLLRFNAENAEWDGRVLPVIFDGIVAKAFCRVSSGSAAQAIAWRRRQGV